MVGTRKTPFAGTTVTLDGSPVRAPVNAEDNTIDSIAVGLLPSWFFSCVDFLGNTNSYATLLGHDLR
jgi:hypothetical protein